jgi:hypothetical protein
MRAWQGITLVLDRTAVLFLGLLAGALIAFSFLPSAGVPTSGAQGSPAQPPVAATTPQVATATDAPGARLAAAIAARRPIEVGVFGDSFGDGVWAGLNNNLRRADGFEVHQLSERSTGFTRYRSLNLLDDARAKLARQPIDIAVLSFGANDTQGIYLDGHGNAFMSEGWQRIVTERVAAIVTLLRRHGAMVYWVGLPRMRDASFDADIRAMNAFYAERMRRLGVPYFETAPISVDAGGHYAPYLPDPRTGERILARTNDGIHMTIPGYVIATRDLSARIRRAVVEARADAGQDAQGRVTGAPAPPRAAGSNG